jgi:uncharacterized protein (DUF486 family)
LKEQQKELSKIKIVAYFGIKFLEYCINIVSERFPRVIIKLSYLL